MGRRVEINGLFYSDSGRKCIEHPLGCGIALIVGDILVLKKETKQFEEELFTNSRVEVLNELTVKELKSLTVTAEIKMKAKAKKQDYVDAILKLEGEEYGANLQVIELRRWSEVVLVAYNYQKKCKVGYLSRAFMNLYSEELDGSFVKILSLKKESALTAEREDGYKNGGVAVVEVVQIEFR
jgi:hypothetical protein